MTDNNLPSIIYISKRCPYCRKILLLLQNKPELKGSIKITCIDDEPFPKIIKSVPSMISDGELWNADELFAALEGRPDTSKQMGGQQQHPQQQQQQQQSDPDDMLDGYFGGGGLTGGSLGFASIDDTPLDTSYFANIDTEDNSVDVNDGYIKKNKKTEAFDSDYERMMSERGEVGAGGMRLGGGM